MGRARGCGVLLALLVTASPTMAAEKGLVARYVAGPIPLDPQAAAWGKLKAVEVRLLPQAIAKPIDITPAIEALSVRALHNGRAIAFRIAWKDATKDAVMYTDTFRDAVAIQIPVAGPTDITMGKPGGRVLILHWKADWQEDIDKTFQDVAQLYPNFWIDWYPFVAGEPPYEMTQWTNPEARRYLTGWVLGNPRSQPFKRVSVEEQIAEGFGTLTTNAGQYGVGKGVWANGQWQVVIARPFAPGDPSDPNWGPGKQTQVAFAAWDGSKGEIGSRKHISNWVPLRIQAARE